MRVALLRITIHIVLGTMIVYVAFKLAITQPLLGVATAYVGGIILYGLVP